MRTAVIMRLAAILAMVGLSACATVDGPRGVRPVALEESAIRYETAPCFGSCPVYAITIMPDGKGTFEGKQFTAVTGTRAFQATPAQYRAFVTKLAPYRPSQNELLYQPGSPGCPSAATDMPSVDVVWSEASGETHHLNVYYGCGPDAMREALRTTPDTLPVTSFIRARHR